MCNARCRLQISRWRTSAPLILTWLQPGESRLLVILPSRFNGFLHRTINLTLALPRPLILIWLQPGESRLLVILPSRFNGFLHRTINLTLALPRLLILIWLQPGEQGSL